MRKGFLLTPVTPAENAKLLHPIESDECPVCLDALDTNDAILLTCRHLLCTACTRSLWHLRRSENASTVHLECPICRSLVKVAHGDLAAFAAAHAASNFIGPVATPHRKPRTDPMGLNTLTVAELKVLVQHFSLRDRVSGSLEREEIERAIETALPARGLGASEASAVSRLPVRSLRAVLDLREIPHDDCVEKAELVERVLQSARGSCMKLPATVLLRMLGDETPPTDKDELARRVMAQRAFRRAAAAQAAQAAQMAAAKSGTGTAQRVETIAAHRRHPGDDDPPTHCCCIVS